MWLIMISQISGGRDGVVFPVFPALMHAIVGVVERGGKEGAMDRWALTVVVFAGSHRIVHENDGIELRFASFVMRGKAFLAKANGVAEYSAG